MTEFLLGCMVGYIIGNDAIRAIIAEKIEQLKSKFNKGE